MFKNSLSQVLVTLVFLVSATASAQQHEHPQYTDEKPAITPASNTDLFAEGEELEYVCPMHSHVVDDEPGTCPICGMNLEPRQAAKDSTVKVSGRIQQALGVRTHRVAANTLWRLIETQGRVEWNTDAVTHAHSRASGWVERLAVKNLGAEVREGELLYTLYSQDMVVAQQDHLQTLDSLNNLSDQRANALRRDGRRRLQLLGFNEAQINALEQTQEVRYEVPFYAKQSGIVTELPIAEGMFIEPNTTIMTIAGRDSLWLIADVPERQSDWLEIGTSVEVDLPQAGLNDFTTKVDYIYPELDAIARTVRVRILLPNVAFSERQKLLVGQQADVDIFGGPKREVLTIPTSALIIAGSQNRVMVQTGENSFAQRDVHVGLIVNDQAEIVHGLEAGDRVVSSGQFLLDSDASLQGNRERHRAADDTVSHQHH